jgi:adenylyltransferase/sulfurtransferase
MLGAESFRSARLAALPGVGASGVARLAASHAVVVGVGALGCQSAELLARAGVGRLTLIDRDVVDLTNLQRQCLYAESDAGLPKATAAAARVRAIHSGVRVQPAVTDLLWSNAAALALGGPLGRPDVIVDGTDNFETRLVLNDLCVREGLPLAYAGVLGFVGTAALLIPDRTPCLRCLLPTLPESASLGTCQTAGVFGPIVAMTAARQGADVLGHLLGLPVAAELSSFDAARAGARAVLLEALRDHDCPSCVRRRFDYLDGTLGGPTYNLCATGAVQVHPRPGSAGTDLPALAERLRPLGRVELAAGVLRAWPDGQHKLTVFADGRALVGGVDDVGEARTVVTRYLGG